jgi:hypothetical protein
MAAARINSLFIKRSAPVARNLLMIAGRTLFTGGPMRISSWLLLAAMLAPAAHAEEAPKRDAGAARESEAASGPAVKKRRLKFKGDRPTCTCVSALSESDIQSAAEQKAAAEPPPRRNEK